MKNLFLSLFLLLFFITITHAQDDKPVAVCTLDATNGATDEALVLAAASCHAANQLNDGKRKYPKFRERLEQGYETMAAAVAVSHRNLERADAKIRAKEDAKKISEKKGKNARDKADIFRAQQRKLEQKYLSKVPVLEKEDVWDVAEKELKSEHVQAMMKLDEEKIRVLYDKYYDLNQEAFKKAFPVPEGVEEKKFDGVKWAGFDLGEEEHKEVISTGRSETGVMGNSYAGTKKVTVDQKAFVPKIYKLEMSKEDYDSIDLKKIQELEIQLALKYQDVPEIMGCRVRKNWNPPLEVICMETKFRIVRNENDRGTVTLHRTDAKQKYVETGSMVVPVCQMGSDFATYESGNGRTNYFENQRVNLTMPESISFEKEEKREFTKQ